MLQKNLASWVCIVSGLQSGRSVVQIPAGAGDIYSPKRPDRLRDALGLLFSEYGRLFFFPLAKAAEAATDLHCNAEILNQWNYICRNNCAFFTFTPTC